MNVQNAQKVGKCITFLLNEITRKFQIVTALGKIGASRVGPPQKG